MAKEDKAAEVAKEAPAPSVLKPVSLMEINKNATGIMHAKRKRREQAHKLIRQTIDKELDRQS